MQKKLSTILGLLLLLAVSIQAQNNQFTLHLDKPFYVTGEKIWYKIYTPVSMEKSKAIKGLILGPNGNVKERFFLRSNPEEAFIDGVFSIPFSYRSGMHRLAFYASAAPGQPSVELVKIDLPIYNDFEIKALAERARNNNVPTDVSSSTPDLEGLQISISLNKKAIAPRRAVNASITVRDAAGNPVNASLSVVARDAELTAQPLPNAATHAVGPVLTTEQLQQFSDEIFIKGELTDTFNNQVQANVLGAYASLQKRIFYGKTNSDGRFTFPLPDFYGEQTLQFIGYPKETEEIKVRILEDGGRPEGKLPINDAILKYLESTQQKKKMAEYFDYLRENIEVSEINNEFDNLESDFTYVAEDYVKFETVGDFFSELLTPLKFRMVDGKYEARMENPRSRDASFSNLPGKPLFIIDGKITRNADFVGRSSWSNVRSVDIFYVSEKLRKQFNILAQGGVARIETKIPQFSMPPNEQEDVFTIQGLTPGGSFVPFQPGSSNAELRLPNFLMPTFWAPNIQTDNNGTASVSFFQGDDASTFVLEVIAKDQNGKMGKASVQYTVQ
ncbi:MAG TPA: hypothetical protein VJ953_16335 [Saprospiraceae bacterium]|nr:hypothetical protein [Saprospiraceae bacterium]